MWKNTLHSLNTRLFIDNIMYKYVHNDKFQMKYRGIAMYNATRKKVKDNIYAKQSKVGNFVEK